MKSSEVLSLTETINSGQPLVSIIMKYLNCARYLREALDSVKAQTFPYWETIC